MLTCAKNTRDGANDEPGIINHIGKAIMKELQNKEGIELPFGFEEGDKLFAIDAIEEGVGGQHIDAVVESGSTNWYSFTLPKDMRQRFVRFNAVNHGVKGGGHYWGRVGFQQGENVCSMAGPMPEITSVCATDDDFTDCVVTAGEIMYGKVTQDVMQHSGGYRLTWKVSKY